MNGPAVLANAVSERHDAMETGLDPSWESVGHAPGSRFLFPARRTLLQQLGPLSLTGTAQRTGPRQPVTAGPTATQA